MHISAGGQQLLHDGLVRRRNGPHQRRGAQLRGGRVGVSAVLQKRADDVEVAGAGRHHQRRESVPLGLAGGRAGGELAFDQRPAGVLGRANERRYAVVVSGIGIGARRQQQLGGREVVAVGGPEEGGHPVGPAGVDIDALVDQRAHRRGILPGRRSDQPEVGFRRRNGRTRGQCAHQNAADSRLPDQYQPHAAPPCNNNPRSRRHDAAAAGRQPPDQRLSRNASASPASASR